MDTIIYNQVLPLPLKDSPLEGSVWRNHVSFNRGTNYLIMADSGKGKSTFLNIIYGTRKDYSGDVLFDAENIKTYSENHICFLRSTKLAYLFQDLRLFPNITARDNILLKPGCKFTNAEIELYAEKLGVSNLLDRNCATLSLGQQQRIAMIRAVSQPFHWLLLDEPFSHLDKTNTGKMMDFILQRCKEENAGILATSLGDKTSFDAFNIVEL